MLCISAVFAVSWCLSICLDTLVDCIQMVEDIVKLLSRSSSPIILVFFTSSTGTQFQWEPLQQRHKIHGGRKILRLLTEITVYLGNGTR